MVLRRTIAALITILLLLMPAFVYAEEAKEDKKAAPPQLLYDKFTKPVKMAIGENGEIYVLDGLTLKRFNNGRVEKVASLLADRERFAKYGLGEPEDIMTFRPGNMVYLNGAIYVAGVMMDRNLSQAGQVPSDGRVKLGTVRIVIMKVTDHFEPLLVDERYKFNADIPAIAYQRLLEGDRDYINDVRYKDYTYTFSHRIWIPNLVPTHDGAMYVILQAAFKDSSSLTQHIYTDSLVGKLLDKCKDNPKNYAYTSTPALYKVYPDGRHEMLDEGILPSNIAGSYRQPNQKHLSEFVNIFNTYMETTNDAYPDKDLIYAVPSTTDRDSSVIVTNGHYIWKYNFKKLECEDVNFVPGSSLPTADQEALIPTYSYTPTMPRVTKNLGIFFLGKHGIWRLYQDKYWQDLNYKIPWIDVTSDWQIDEDRMKIYYTTRDGKLYSVDLAEIFGMHGGGPAASGNTLKVIYDRNREVIYGVKGSKGVYHENGKLYVPIDPILAFLNISLYEDGMEWIDDKYARVPVEYKPLALAITLRVRAEKQGDIVQKHMPIDELFDRIHAITGKWYSYRYDEATNTLYIDSTPNDLPLFDGYW